MKFTVQTILSMPVDQASSHLLIFDDEFSVLLDCGISHAFDFSKYLQKAQQLKTVNLVLISHSNLQYSGAIAFLINEIGLNPKVFYTTQAIMRYSPYNVYESLLGVRFKNYTKKMFTQIYKKYESINIIKPLQKKSIDLQSALKKKPQQSVAIPNPNPNPNPNAMQQQTMETICQAQKTLYFTCFNAGSNMGSLAWRLSFGIINILYLVQYNNYSLYHIGGIDLQQICQPTDIMITDTYPDIDDSLMKKNNLYNRIKDLIIRFYEKSAMSYEKPPVAINIENQRKLLFSCYPNEMVIQVMAVVKKVIEDIQSPESRQKVRVVHLSSRFLQLIKSQMDYFSPYFKDTLQNIQQFFIHSKQISGRINICTFESLDGLICSAVNTKSVEVYQFGQYISGQKITASYLQNTHLKGEQNVSNLKFFNTSLYLQERLSHSASKIDIQNQQEDAKMENQVQNAMKQPPELTEQKQSVSEVPDEVEIIRDVQPQVHQPLHGKYFSQVGFPRFTSREQEHIFDQYGYRHQYARFQQRRAIQDYRRQTQTGSGQTYLQKKNSTIQIMNIQFRVAPQSVNLDLSKISILPFFSYKTNFNSSIQLIATLKPSNVILINTVRNIPESPQSLANRYKLMFKAQSQSSQGNRPIVIYNIQPKGYCHIQLQNQLISYKVNYIPIPIQRKLQKVKGVIKYSSDKNILYIHLDCLDEREHLEFRLEKFYKKVKTQPIHQCFFTKNGLVIDGIRIYRQGKKIVLHGEYSEHYFKVRRLLYDFLKME